MMDIQFGDAVLGIEEREAVLRVLDSGRLTRGENCESFEAALTGLTGYGSHVVSSGTAALHLALLAAGVKKGDRVVVPATTYIATANAILYCGAKPVVVDVDSETWTISFERAVEAVEEHNATAIMPVHLYGAPAADFMSWRDDYYRATGRLVRIIEDAAESLGCLRSGAHPCGDFACLSFFGSKTITTGEGGAVLYRDEMLGRRVRHLAGQAQTKTRYLHDACGFNYRMTEVAAAIGEQQLRRLPAFLAARQRVFWWYDQFLSPKWVRQKLWKDDSHGMWAYAVRRVGMDAPRVIRRMAMAGIETRPIFPWVTMHRHLKNADADPLPMAGALHREGIVLPTHVNLTRDDVRRVCDELEAAADTR